MKEVRNWHVSAGNKRFLKMKALVCFFNVENVRNVSESGGRGLRGSGSPVLAE